jgi:SEC-C motif
VAEWRCGTCDRHIASRLDQMVIFGETHRRRILSTYAAYYNQARTHLALHKMRPCIEQSNDLVPLSPFRSWLDCITNTSGYDFRKGHLCPCGSGKKFKALPWGVVGNGALGQLPSLRPFLFIDHTGCLRPRQEYGSRRTLSPVRCVSGKSADPPYCCSWDAVVPCCTSFRRPPCAGRAWDRESRPRHRSR